MEIEKGLILSHGKMNWEVYTGDIDKSINVKRKKHQTSQLPYFPGWKTNHRRKWHLAWWKTLHTSENMSFLKRYQLVAALRTVSTTPLKLLDCLKKWSLVKRKHTQASSHRPKGTTTHVIKRQVSREVRPGKVGHRSLCLSMKWKAQLLTDCILHHDIDVQWFICNTEILDITSNGSWWKSMCK